MQEDGYLNYAMSPELPGVKVYVAGPRKPLAARQQ